MMQQDMARYILACKAPPASASQSRLDTIFAHFGVDGPERMKFLSEDGFQMFYLDACTDRPDAVWNDLNLHGYRNDLRHESEVAAADAAAALQRDSEEQQAALLATQRQMPRHILSSEPAYFGLLFRALALGDDEVTSQVWTLLQRLPTNPELYHALSTLDFARLQQPQPKSQPQSQPVDWNATLDSSSEFKLLYALQIVEALMEPVEASLPPPGADEALLAALAAQDQRLQQQRADWRHTFLDAGGFAHLYATLVARASAPKSHSVASAGGAARSLHQSCLNLLLKLVSSFLLTAISAVSQQSDLLDLVDRVRALQLNEGEEEEDSKDGKAAAGASAGGDEKDEKEAKDPDDWMDFTMDEDDLQAKRRREAEAKAPEESSDALLPAVPSLKRQSSNDQEMRLLSRQLSSAFALQMIQSVDFEQLQRCIFALLSSASESAGSSSSSSSSSATVYSSGSIAEHACHLWVSLLLYRRTLLVPAFYRLLAEDASLLTRVLHAPHKATRAEFARALYQITASADFEASGEDGDAYEPPHKLVLRVLLDAISGSNGNGSEVGSEEFFALLTRLLKDACGGRCGGKASDFAALLRQLVERVQKHAPQERSDCDPVDKALVGMCNVVAVLCAQDASFRAYVGEQSGLVDDLFHRFLFTTDQSSPYASDAEARGLHLLPKCKTRGARQSAFALLAELSSSEANRARLLSLLEPHVSQSVRAGGWDYDPGKVQRSASGYVGLKNQTSTCYMNSLLQQFFMMPHFRAGVLSAPDKEADKSESLLFQFQRLFTFLSFSERQYYDTLPFCFAYKDETVRSFHFACCVLIGTVI